jgi:uncharacterized repeat protein (TIGR01451 family)
LKTTHNADLPAILFCALMLAVFSETRTAGAASLDYFTWNTVASPRPAGAPFNAVLLANDSSGNVISNYSGSVTVSAKTQTTSPLVISEVDNGTTNQVELTNPSTNSADISGWQVVFYDSTRWPQPVTTFTIPTGTICPPGGVFTIAEGGITPGIFPMFRTGSTLNWTTTANPVAVSLLDTTSHARDFFCASTAFPFLITNPVPVLPGVWYGGPVSLNSSSGNTYQRQGNFNQRQAVNWTATSRSVGILNPSLSIPLVAEPTTLGMISTNLFLTNGIWSGPLTITTTGSNVMLIADNGLGNPGLSNPFDVVAGTSVVLSLPTQTSNSSPGFQPASISIPGPLGFDLTFTLASSVPTKIGTPATVVVPAGATNAGFQVTNFNDTLIDGVQVITITASNDLFLPVQHAITNFSAPVQLSLSLPIQVNQQPGSILGQGQLSTTAPATSDYQVQISSDDTNLLFVPTFVQIKAGQTNLSFSFSQPVGSKTIGNRLVTVTAFAGATAAATNSILLLGLYTNLTLSLPSPLLEGSGVSTNAIVSLAAAVSTNVTVTLASGNATALQVPSSAVIIAGQTSVNFPVTVPINFGPGSNLVVEVTASASGFGDANAPVTIQDDHLDHFDLAGVPLAQAVNQPFNISMAARNQSGDLLSNYTGTATLSLSGFPNGTLLPSMTGNFTNGIWSGAISINTPATNVIVKATNGLASGQSNPFDVQLVVASTLSLSVADLVYDPGTDRIYATIPSNAGPQSNTVMRLNPYTGSIEANIPVDTNPGLMALSASNQFIYLAVQGGYSVQRFNLASQLPDLEFAVPQSFFGNWVGNLIGIPNSPVSVAIYGASGGISQDYIFDGSVARTNLADLALTPGLDQYAVLSGGRSYLPSGLVLAPTNQAVGQFQVTGTVTTGPVAPDPSSGSAFFLSQQNGQTVISAYDSATFTLRGSQTISGVVGTPQNLIRWGTNGLAFSTTGNQLFLIQSPLCAGPSSARLFVSQSGPTVAAVGESVTYTIFTTNLGSISATDVLLYDPLPLKSTFLTASSSQGSVATNNGSLIGLLGTIPPYGSTTITLTVAAQSTGVLTNTVKIVTTAADTDPALYNSTCLTVVTNSASNSPTPQLPISANDLIYNPTDGKLYASISGRSASFGNSVVTIDPVTLQISNPIAAGSEPGALALAPDGRYLYVYLKSTASLELVDLQTRTVTFQYSLYADGFVLTEMFVLPGSSNSLVFSQHWPGGSPSDRGVKLIAGGITSPLPGGDLIQPSVNSNVFYSYANTVVPSSITRIVFNGTNATSTSSGGLTIDLEPEIRSAGGLLFFSSGEVIDPEVMIRLGIFPGLAGPLFQSQPLNHICPDLASGRVFYLATSGSTATISAYSLNNYQLVGTFQVNGIAGTPEQLVRWGTNGFAFATTGGQVFSFQASLVPTNQPADLQVAQAAPGVVSLATNFSITITASNQGPGVATGVMLYDVLPAGTRFLSASTTQGTLSTNGGAISASLGTLNPGGVAQVSIVLRPELVNLSSNYVRISANEPDLMLTNNSSVTSIAIATNVSRSLPLYIGDLVYDPTRGKVFATVQNVGPYSNSIVQIDPLTGNVEQVLPTSFVPARITVTADGQFLYVGDSTEGNVTRINIQSWTNDLSFALGNTSGINYVVADFATLTGQPHSIVVSMHAWYGNYSPQVRIFDDGIERSNSLSEAGGGTYFIETSPDASTLYVVNANGSIGYAQQPLTLIPYTITASGVGAALTNLTNFSSDFQIENNQLITENGKAINLQNFSTVGTYPVSGRVAPDLEDGIVYYLVNTGSIGTPYWALEAFSTNTHSALSQFTVPGATGAAFSLHRCGPNLLAFATVPSENMNYGLNALGLFFINTSGFPAGGDLVLTAPTNSAYAGALLTNTFNILNDGSFFNATGVTFTNVLPAGSTFISAKSSQGTCTQTNGVVTCTIGSMTGGSTVTVTVVSTVSNAGPAQLQASVSKNEPDTDPSNNQISFTETIYAAPVVTVSSPTVYRQAGVTANFRISLSAPGPLPFSLYCYTTNGSALAPGDYTFASNVVTIAAGATFANFPVTIKNSGLVQTNVVFYLNVSLRPSSQPIAIGTCTLVNGNFYSFAVTNTSVIVRPSGVTNAVFFVTLSGSNPVSTSVDYFTRDGNAVSGADYLGKAGTLLFPAGVKTQALSISIYPAAASGSTKIFYLMLANPANATLGISQASASIQTAPLVIGPSTLLPDGRFQLTIGGGVAMQNYALFASTDLVSWTSISNFVNTNQPITIYDGDAASHSRRFYRIGPTNP